MIVMSSLIRWNARREKGVRNVEGKGADTSTEEICSGLRNLLEVGSSERGRTSATFAYLSAKMQGVCRDGVYQSASIE